jgi:cytochrome c553
MKSATILSLLAAALALSATSAVAGGDPVAGKAKTVTCVACHGQDGNSIDPQYPRLAGQYADYMEQALHEYKSGQRDNAIMKGFASQLSDQDIADVAAYFSQMPGKLDDLKHHIEGSN